MSQPVFTSSGRPGVDADCTDILRMEEPFRRSCRDEANIAPNLRPSSAYD